MIIVLTLYKNLAMKKIYLLGALFLSIMTFAQNSKQEKIREMMNLTGAGSYGEQMAKIIFSIMKENSPDVPDIFWEEINKEIKADEITEMIINVYDKHFTEKEIDDILAFYNTQTGKKFVEKLPIILQDAGQEGEKWGKEIGKKVFNTLKDKYGYDIPEELLQ